MYDIEASKESLKKLQAADYDVGALTPSEKNNLVNMLDDFWVQQGWDLDELKNPYQTHQNKN